MDTNGKFVRSLNAFKGTIRQNKVLGFAYAYFVLVNKKRQRTFYLAPFAGKVLSMFNAFN